MRLMIVFSFLLSTACSTGVKLSHVTEGKKVFTAKCNGGFNTIADCHKQAAETCPTGYDILDKGGSNAAFYNPSMGHYQQVTRRNLMFSCKS